ncbi:MAG: peptide deformylase, partial [Rickettsiales bacterium]|nr:peptide deformylase [Rickettsiales bacterium]
MEDLSFLRRKCDLVEIIDAEIISNLDKMLEYMYKNDGIGLAANQIKIFKRLVVIDLQENNKKNPLFLINPEIVEKSDEMILGPESCLSIRNITANVNRHKHIKVKYLEKSGKTKELDAGGLLSICLQHEIDLLDGVVFLDRAETKTSEIQKALDKIDKNNENNDNSGLKVFTIVDDMKFLRQKSEPVKKIDQELTDLMENMLKTMYQNSGIGLAGVQVGILKRIIVIDIQDGKKSPLFLINPTIVKHSENVVDSEEGCLSVPEEREKIKRYETVTVEYTNEKNKEIIL